MLSTKNRDETRFRETMEKFFGSGVFLEASGVEGFCWLWARVGREETRWRRGEGAIVLGFGS